VNLKIIFKYFLENIITRKTQSIVFRKINSTTIIIANKSDSFVLKITIKIFLDK